MVFLLYVLKCELLLHKCFRTNRTLVWSIIVVKHLVFDRDSFCYKPFPAILANIALLPGFSISMDSADMVSHMRLLGKIFTTMITFVRLFSCVY